MRHLQFYLIAVSTTPLYQGNRVVVIANIYMRDAIYAQGFYYIYIYQRNIGIGLGCCIHFGCRLFYEFLPCCLDRQIDRQKRRFLFGGRCEQSVRSKCQQPDAPPCCLHYYTQTWSICTYGKINVPVEVMSKKKWHISLHEGNMRQQSKSRHPLRVSPLLVLHKTHHKNYGFLTEFLYQSFNYTLVGALGSCTTQSKSDHPHDQKQLTQKCTCTRHASPSTEYAILQSRFKVEFDFTP